MGLHDFSTFEPFLRLNLYRAALSKVKHNKLHSLSTILNVQIFPNLTHVVTPKFSPNVFKKAYIHFQRSFSATISCFIHCHLFGLMYSYITITESQSLRIHCQSIHLSIMSIIDGATLSQLLLKEAESVIPMMLLQSYVFCRHNFLFGRLLLINPICMHYTQSLREGVNDVISVYFCIRQSLLFYEVNNDATSTSHSLLNV